MASWCGDVTHGDKWLQGTVVQCGGVRDEPAPLIPFLQHNFVSHSHDLFKVCALWPWHQGISALSSGCVRGFWLFLAESWLLLGSEDGVGELGVGNMGVWQ